MLIATKDIIARNPGIICATGNASLLVITPSIKTHQDEQIKTPVNVEITMVFELGILFFYL